MKFTESKNIAKVSILVTFAFNKSFPAVILFGQALTFLRLEIPIFSIHFMATGISIIACILLTFVTAITLKLHLE